MASRSVRSVRSSAHPKANAGARPDSGTTSFVIGLDWGTSSLRAYLLGRNGRNNVEIIERRESADGILHVPSGGFENVLERAVGDWLDRYPGVPLIASGMIGSRAGWVEVPYVSVPAGLPEIAAGMVSRRYRNTTLWLVPGLAQRSARNGVTADVMRGEETQIVGATPEAGRYLSVLPGTHSKWARVEDGKVVGFVTYFTGELFGHLSQRGTLSQLMAPEASEEAEVRGFHAGLEASRSRGLLGGLFSVRARVLLEELPADEALGFLSGLLLGAEIDEASARLGGAESEPIEVISEPVMAARYSAALEQRGFLNYNVRVDAAARGLFRLARSVLESARAC